MKKIKSNRNKKINILKKSKKGLNKEIKKEVKEAIRKKEINKKVQNPRKVQLRQKK